MMIIIKTGGRKKNGIESKFLSIDGRKTRNVNKARAIFIVIWTVKWLELEVCTQRADEII